MIGQIGPLGKGPWRTAAGSLFLYTLGVTLSAGLLGLALGLIGWIVRWVCYAEAGSVSPSVLTLVAFAALIGGLRDMGMLRLSLPQPPRQVPQVYMEVLGPLKTSFWWGVGIGFAYQTRIEYSLYYVLALWIVLLGHPLLGAGLLALYAFTLALSLSLETLAIAARRCDLGGILGFHRAAYFHPVSGLILIALTTFLMSYLA